MIRIERDQALITDWTIQDPDIVAFLHGIQADDADSWQQECENALYRALRIGVVALERAEIRTDLDAIRREFDDWQIQVQSSLDSIFKEEDGRMALALGRYLGDGGRLDDLFDPQRRDSAVGRVQAIFDDHFGGDGAKFARLLDCTRRDSPLWKLRSAFGRDLDRIEQQLSDLQKHLAREEGKAEERELGTRKGLDFEEVLLSRLDHLSKPFRDVVTDVSTIAAADGSKKGDLVIQLDREAAGGQDAYIVIEAKRTRKPITGRTGILQELEQAMASRQAQFGIAVFSEDICPDEIGHLRAYPKNRIVCSIDQDGEDFLALEVAYQLARTELCWQLRRDARGLDHAKVAKAVRYAEEKIGQFRGLKQNASSLVSTADMIREQLNNIEFEIRSALKEILAELEPED